MSVVRVSVIATAALLIVVNVNARAQATDLGGSCCSDLADRIDELEATVARKSTRKMSLELWGQVNKAIIAWNDGVSHNVALGSDNTNSTTRFGLRGNAKIATGWSAGYAFMLDILSGSRGTSLSQFADHTNVSGLKSTGNPPRDFGAFDSAVVMREANWWMENAGVGRLTVGRYSGTNAGLTGTIDVAGIGATAAANTVAQNGSNMSFRTNRPSVYPSKAGTGNLTNYTIATVTDGTGEYGEKQNGVMYISPTLAGFTAAAAIAGSVSKDGLCQNASCTASFGVGPMYSLSVRYAGEFSGIRIAASIGYENADNAGASDKNLDSNVGTSMRPASINTGGALSLMHQSTGLFAQGHYVAFRRGHDSFSATGAPINPLTATDTAIQWLLQAGIAKNWFGIGNTVLYGEYSRITNGYNVFSVFTGPASSSNGVLTSGGVGTNYFGDNTKAGVWGLGVVQYLDAAAMDIYAGYRNFSLTSDNCTAAGGCKDIGVLVSGARIRF